MKHCKLYVFIIIFAGKQNCLKTLICNVVSAVYIYHIWNYVPGEYRVGIKFNDQHIPDSPYKLFISPAMGDAHKLEVFQFPNSGVQADKPAAFLVRKNGAKGELDAKVSV